MDGWVDEDPDDDEEEDEEEDEEDEEDEDEEDEEDEDPVDEVPDPEEGARLAVTLAADVPAVWLSSPRLLARLPASGPDAGRRPIRLAG